MLRNSLSSRLTNTLVNRSLSILNAILLLTLLTISAAAQSRPQQNAGDAGNVKRFRLRGQGPHAGDWLRQNRDLPPNDQLRALESDPRYKSLPSQRQLQLRNRLQQFNSLPPKQRDRILNRMETWEHMSSDQRQQARGVFDGMRNLPDNRRGMVRRAYRDLQNMSPEEQQKVLSSDRYRNTFNEDERNLIKRSLELNLRPQDEANASK